MLNGYINYLKFLDEKLEKFFKSQKPFIFCKKGCARCCKNAQFPYSVTEMKYLLSGLLTLDKDTLSVIEKNLENVLGQKNLFKGKKFRYDCPFLIDNQCSVYHYRGVVCRTFGLMTKYENDKLRAPFCTFQGLNYSNVLNLKKRTISPVKYKKLNVTEEPLGFNVSYKYLTDEDFEKAFCFKFGEKKPLIEWFIPSAASDKGSLKKRKSAQI